MKALRTALSALVCLIALSGAAFAQNPGPGPGVYTPPSNGTLPNPITVPINNASQTTTGTFNFTDTTGNGGSKINGGCINGVCPVTAFGAKCDNSTNDATAIQAAFTAAAALCNNASTTATVSFPPANAAGATAICIDNSALTRNACVNVEGNGATLSQTNASSSANLITVTAPTSGKIDSYFRDLHVYGPNGTSVGLLLQTSGGGYEDVDIANVGTGVQVGNNAFLTQFVNFTVSGYNTYGFYCPNSLTNAGENIRWTNGGIYNGNGTGIAINNQNCEFNGDGLSLDFPGDSFIKSATTGPSGPSLGSAATRLLNYHLETSGTIANSDPAIDTGSGSSSTAGCNSYSQVVLRNGIILNDAPGTNSLAIVRDSGVACNAGGAAAWVTIDNSQISGWGNSGTCIASNSQDVGNTCVLGVNATQVKLSNISDGVLAYLSVGPLAVLNGITSTGPTAITGNSGAGSDFIKAVCVNGICPATAFGANAETTNPAAVTATTNGTGAVALSGAGNFKTNSGIVIYGGGAACNINSTDCGSITSPTPTVTWNGFSGSTEYDYKISSCDAAWGCAAAGSAGTTSTGVAVLSQPNEGASTGQYPGLTWTATTGAAHYLLWRQKASGGYLLWAATDTNSFNDFSNQQKMGITGPYGNTPIVAAQADTYQGTVSAGGGTTSLTVTPAVTQTGSLSAWPDETVAIQACITGASTLGGTCQLPAGFYKVLNLTPKHGVALVGAGDDPSTNKASVILGTSGYDVFTWASSADNVFRFQDLNISGGRDALNEPISTVSYVKLIRVTLNGPDYAGIEASGDIEEWDLDTVVFINGWYGVDMNGAIYIQKSLFDKTTFNGPAVNGFRMNTNTQIFAGVTLRRTITQAIGHDGLYFNAPTQGVTIDGYSDEGVGSDFTRASTTATCTATSNVYAFTSVTGFNVGDFITVVGCGTGGDIAQGYICAGGISANNVTLKQSDCSTAVNAGTTQSTAQFTTNSPFDNIYWGNGGGSLSSVSIKDAVMATSGGCCGGTQTRWQFNTNTGVVTYINSNGKVYNAAGIDTFVQGANMTLYRDTIGGIGFQTSSFSLPGTGGPLAQTFSSLVSPAGADINNILNDSTNNGSGTIGTWRVRQYNSNRDTLFQVVGSATSRDNASIGWRGSLQSLGQTAPTLTAGCNGSGSSVAGSNNSGVITTQSSGAATTCTMTFAGGGFPAAPHCVFTDDNASITPASYSSGAVSATTAVVDFVSATSAKIGYVCF